MSALYHFGWEFVTRLIIALYSPIWIGIKQAGLPFGMSLLLTFVLAKPIYGFMGRTKLGLAIALFLSGIGIILMWFFGW